ncbi:MAG: YdcF family protein [Clostridia bacterium]
MLICLIAGVLAEGVLYGLVHWKSVAAYPAESADVVIVLGARVMPDGELSTTLDYRIRTAYEAYQAGRVGALIVCGAQGADEPTTEAEAMAQYLYAQGVAKDKVFIEAESTDTRENLLNAKEIMEKAGYQSALLVTSDYHLQRALWIGQDVGLNAVGCPAPGPDLWYNQVKARLRETLSWINYFVRRVFA